MMLKAITDTFRRIVTTVSVKLLLALFLVVGVLTLGLTYIRYERNPWSRVTSGPAYIPKPRLLPASAVLDFEHALVFSLKDNCFGYILFSEAFKTEARYECGMYKWNDKRLDCIFEATNSVVKLDTESPQVVCGNLNIYWLPATALFFTGKMKCVAIVEAEELKKIKVGNTNDISWSIVNISPK